VSGLSNPAQSAAALTRAKGGAWLPQDVQARQRSTQHALAPVQRQQPRLLDAYLAGVVHLAELDRKRQELRSRM
jgi:hypothetical protein